MRNNLHGIHIRVKLFSNAIKQTERTPDQQQVGGNGPDALADLHADIHRIDIFPAPAERCRVNTGLVDWSKPTLVQYPFRRKANPEKLYELKRPSS